MPRLQQPWLVLPALLALLASQHQHQVAAAAAVATSSSTEASESPLPGVADATSDVLVEWVRQHGGEVNVAIRSTPDRGRTTFAVRDMQQGDVLARIPAELVYVVNHTWGDSNEAAGAQLIIDMADNNSFWRPLFNSYPLKSEVFCHPHIPDSYLPILQDADVETSLRWTKQSMQHYCDKLQPTYRQLGLNVTLEDCMYGLAMMLTRVFNFQGKPVMLPVIDHANHNNACVHTHRLEPCDPDKGLQQWQQGLTPPAIPSSLGAGLVAGGAGGDGGDASACPNTSACSANTTGSDSGGGVSGVCITWRAETAVARGQEVHNTYGTMTNDRSLLQYGFLQKGAAIELALQSIDRPERPAGLDGVWYKADTFWSQGMPLPFRGTTEQELRHEVVRLRERLAKLKSGDAAIAAIVPDAAADPDGSILALMHTWRRQRLRAIEAEIETLEEDANSIGLEVE